ncbi:asparagine synthase (glutamine-hydrolyzing) [Microvirga sp. 2TAF3]|uniref:asparagine synthase (glutamine-hydrolyzing) n=1 Tax=Microvirga sp. 2TAF3 TaxID=3233014 RepID=UPI003F960E47
MCGIAGYFGDGLDPAVGRSLLQLMTGTVAHRGPDEQSTFVSNGAGLGHARLSIIGLANGQQPMGSAAGDLWISFNGEIFNYIELRNELMALGRHFRTSSDTEVILHLYDEMGPECVTRLNGDFAFALWDARRHRMMLARDRMGVRPLFHTMRAGTLFFASEVKALLEVPGIEAEIDPFALDEIFTLWAPIAPRTPFKDIAELPPAHIMIVDRNGAMVKPYWRLTFPDRTEARDERSESKIIEELRALLEDATRIRLRADVPVGAYLSGGLDSSITSALAARQVPELRTYSVIFDSEEHDESAQQDEMVSALGTRHSVISCHNSDIANVFPDVVRHMERPVIRTAPAPLYLLSQLVRDQGFKVVLTGEGADEVFAGYDIFKESSVRRFCARQPDSHIRPHLFRRLYSYLPGLKQQSPEYLAAFFGAGPALLDDPLFSHRPRLRSTAAAKIFFSGDLRATLGDYDAAAELAERLPPDYGRWHPLHQAQYIETSFLLPGYILSSQGDRMAMAHGVEGRFPFLDHRLVEFAARIPAGMKLKGLREKHILREATKDLLPSSINARTKQPYRAPDSQCFTTMDAPNYIAAAFSPGAISATGLFNPQAVDKLYAKCRRQEDVSFRDNTAFVGILSTQLWHRSFATRSGTHKIQAA